MKKALLILLFAPSLAFAQTQPSEDDFKKQILNLQQRTYDLEEKVWAAGKTHKVGVGISILGLAAGIVGGVLVANDNNTIGTPVLIGGGVISLVGTLIRWESVNKLAPKREGNSNYQPRNKGGDDLYN